MENIAATNSSIQECYVFRTLPGVRYRVESSHDLSQWTTEDEIYGLGHEYGVAMREFTPPPPPEPGSDPPAPSVAPTKSVSLVIQASSEPAGGTVVSWRSLDHGGPVVCLLDQSMTSGWNQMPLFWNNYGNFSFFILHNMQTVLPPGENPQLSTQDAAMFSELENSFAAMNLAIDDSVARARNAPPPAPSDPNSRKFWRVHCDWSIDTDQDGTPDWSEFEMMAQAAAGQPVSTVGDFSGGTPPSGNAFSADSNGDGIPDGKQLDTDRDGVADTFDIAKSDATATYEIGPLPRYAVFPITNAEPFEGYPTPVQINDMGTVLYANGIWNGGTWTSLPGATKTANSAVMAARMNDHDEIIGIWSGGEFTGASGQATDAFSLPGNIVYWPNATSWCDPVSVGDGAPWIPSPLFSYPGEPGTQLSNGGQLIGYQKTMKRDENGQETGIETDGTFLWTLPGMGRTPGKTAIPLYEGGVLEATHYWGWSTEENTRQLYSEGVALNPPGVIQNLHIGPQGELIACFEYGQDTQVYKDGQWRPSPTFAKAIDLAADGTAIGRSHDGLTAPILLNGKWTEVRRTAPDVPAAWKDSSVKLLDTTPGGWILAGRGSTSPYDYSVMLPLRITESPPDSDFLEATGVDAYSIKSEDPGAAVSDRIWIMAPAGSGSTKVTLKSPLNSGTPLELSAAGIKFDDSPKITLTEDNKKFDITASSPDSTGTDIPLAVKLGPVESVSRPVGVKVMKRRTVNVSLHPLGSWVAGKASNEPDLVPDKAELEAHLNKVFSPQINAVFVVKMIPPRNFEWDKATPEDFGAQDPNNKITVGNGWLDTNGSPTHYTEDAYIPTELNDTDANINIYILGGGRIRTVLTWDGIIRTVQSIVFGMTRVTENTIFIDGDIGWYHTTLGNDPRLEQLRTIAHEVGHCLVGEGHADTGDAAVKLKGFNPSNLVQERLMVSGNLTRQPVPGCRLVKGEWDETEKWMKKEELAGRMQP